MTQNEDRIEALVSVVHRAARIHGSTVELTELERLLPEGTRSGLDSAFREVSGLRERFELIDGKIVERGEVSQAEPESKRRARALANIGIAKRIAERLWTDDAVTIAVSGSSSYLSAGQGDDIDLFCITRSEKMWLFVAKALILSRSFKIMKRCARPVTLSCVMDEAYAREMFRCDLGPLLARDALNAEVIRGVQAYNEFLASAHWMCSYFPALYRLKLRSTRTIPVDRAHAGSGPSPLNRLLYVAVGAFIKFKAAWHNKLLAKGGKDEAVFQMRLGPNYLIYESTRYLSLKSIYSRIRPVDSNGQLVLSNEDETQVFPYRPP